MVSEEKSGRPVWQTVMVFALAFWVSASLLVDMVMMPVLYTSGMMTEPGFATAGYSMFWVFNRVELLCAALILTASLVLYCARNPASNLRKTGLILSALLLDIALVYTYGLAPAMSTLGLQLNLFNSTVEVPALMNSLHMGYWLLEIVKLALAGLLLKQCYFSSDDRLTSA